MSENNNFGTSWPIRKQKHSGRLTTSHCEGRAGMILAIVERQEAMKSNYRPCSALLLYTTWLPCSALAFCNHCWFYSGSMASGKMEPLATLAGYSSVCFSRLLWSTLIYVIDSFCSKACTCYGMTIICCACCGTYCKERVVLSATKFTWFCMMGLQPAGIFTTCCGTVVVGGI